ncbi:MAG: HNH endonuclease signature motif containing protein [candidate division WOR-3 bacterium]
MARAPNTDAKGRPFARYLVDRVWLKAEPVSGFYMFRRDACGTEIAKQEFGKTTPLGWEVDHIRPIALGGTDDLDNLQPLHWKNNRRKADTWPDWRPATCTGNTSGQTP